MVKKIFLSLIILLVFILPFLVKKSQHINLSEAKTSLSAYVLKTEPTQKMIVYEITAVEKIKRIEALSLFWRLISSSNVETEMLVPVKYSYYIDFSEGFEIEKVGSIYKITAPPLKSYQPAVDVSGISFQVKEAPFFYNTKNIENKILKQLTDHLTDRSEQLKTTYYNEARRSVEKVVQNWIMSNKNYEIFNENPIRIVFRGENQSVLN